ncbi:MAG TPA: YetF domain-containing protein [Pseudolabrys sp.]
MDSVIKATVVYFALWAVIRVSGRRTLGEMTAFDFVLFMIIGGSTQRAITGQDYSLTNALLLVATFVALDIGLSIVELKWPAMRRILNAMPMILVENGSLMAARMRRARITEDNILVSARRLNGLERIDQIKFAILEASGEITIVPAEQAGPAEPMEATSR